METVLQGKQNVVPRAFPQQQWKSMAGVLWLLAQEPWAPTSVTWRLPWNLQASLAVKHGDSAGQFWSRLGGGSNLVHFIKWSHETLDQMLEPRWENRDTKVGKLASWHSENWQARRESGQGVNTTSFRKSLTSIPEGLGSGSSIRSIVKLYEFIIDKCLTNTSVENNPLPISIWMKRESFIFLSHVTLSVDI